MHEYSIVSSLIELCEENARQNNATKIIKINIAIGKLSGVEPVLLKSAFDTFKEEGITKESELVVEIKEIVLQCQKCGHQYTPQGYEYLCPKCGSEEYSIISGEEMHLMSLEME